MKIALVFPESTFLIDPMVYPPLGLWYIGAQLEALGHECDFFDLSVDECPHDGDYDQLWVSATSPQLHAVRELGKEFCGWLYTKTVLGGPAIWAVPNPDGVIGFDVIVSGEVDQPHTIEEILGALPGSTLNYGTQTDKDSMQNVLPPIRRWSHRYNAGLEDRNGTVHRTTTMFTSRGCPMACAFCESGRNGIVWDRFVRYEPLETVEHQLKEIADLGFTAVMFYDDILPLNKPRTLEIMRLLRKYDLKWRCFLRTDIIIKQGGYEYLKEMADAGLLEVLAGVESADNRIKENIMKGTTIEEDTQVLEWCKQLGIKFKSSFILGLPGEDWESMNATREWIIKYRPDRADVNTLIPFPGTPLTNPALQDMFDLTWEEEWPEEIWYKGPRESSQAVISTSSLTSHEIKQFRDDLVQEMEELGIPY